MKAKCRGRVEIGLEGEASLEIVTRLLANGTRGLLHFTGKWGEG